MWKPYTACERCKRKDHCNGENFWCECKCVEKPMLDFKKALIDSKEKQKKLFGTYHQEHHTTHENCMCCNGMIVICLSCNREAVNGFYIDGTNDLICEICNKTKANGASLSIAPMVVKGDRAMAETEFQKYARQANETWGQKKNAVPGVPDGTYELQLQSCELKKSNSDKWMVQREHVVTEGQYTGEVIRDYIGLEGDFGPRQLNEFIQKMGHESPEDFGEVEGIISTIASDSPSYQGKVKKAKDGDLRNVTILQVYAPGEAPSSAPAATETKKPSPGKKTAPAPVASGRAVGDEVKFAEGEEILEGKIVELKPDGAVMETDDGSLYEQTFEYIYDKDGEAATEEPAAEEPAAETEDTSNLIAFSQAHGIEVAEDESAESIRDKLRSFEFTRDELTKEEQEILDGIEGISWKEKPKPAPVKKTTPPPAKKPAPAPAKKTVAPPAKKPAPTPAKKSPPPKKK